MGADVQKLAGKEVILIQEIKGGKHFDPVTSSFFQDFTNSRCAGYILFLDTYPDNLTNLSAAEPGFLLVKS